MKQTYLGNSGDHADDDSGGVVRSLRLEESVWTDDITESDTDKDESGGDLSVSESVLRQNQDTYHLLGISTNVAGD